MSFNSDRIVVHSGAAAIRLRPDMYVGDLGNPLLPNLLLHEVLGFVCDVSLSGSQGRVEVELARDGRARLADTGRPLPHRVTSFGENELELLLTRLPACGRSDPGSPRRDALWDVSLAVLNALSAEFFVRVYDGINRYELMFREGVVIGPLDTSRFDHPCGNEIEFRLDAGIFPHREFDFEELTSWARAELGSFEIAIRDLRSGQEVCMAT